MSTAELWRLFEQRFAPPGATAEDRRQRSFVALSLLLLIPVVVAFGAEDLRQGSSTQGAVVLGLAGFMMSLLMGLGKVRRVAPLLRFGLVLVLALLSYLQLMGGGEGFAFFWFYSIPVLALTLFGQREGTVWALAALAGAGLSLAASHGDRYEPENFWRFLITYVLVLIFSYGLESARYRCYSQILAEKASIEETLAQVRTLRGLLPICTRCKSIRDDDGYWQRLESFIDLHSDAEFSHGVCPTCVGKLYPEYLDDSEGRL